VLKSKTKDLLPETAKTNTHDVMAGTLADYFRLPTDLLGPLECDEPTGNLGFFRFGPNMVSYGRCKSGQTAMSRSAKLYDSSKDIRINGDSVQLSLDPAQAIENLRNERYTAAFSNNGGGKHKSLVGNVYYAVRRYLPDWVRRRLQRMYLRDWENISFPNWPVDSTVDMLHQQVLLRLMRAKGVRRIPFVWFWPDGARNCLVMTHDVETSAGRDFSSSLMDLDEAYGFKASFQVVPESRYEIPNDYVNEIRQRGFELNIHDFNHDGHLFDDHQEFLRRAAKINQYARNYGALGFRSAVMYRNQEWLDALEFSYDMSVPNVARLDPQRGGCCTVMPYFIRQTLELPLTTTQDYSMFHILRRYSIDLWKHQLSLLAQNHGLMSFIVHPDYVIESRARRTYEALLDYLRDLVVREYVWTTLPGEVDRWWRARAKMKVVPKGNEWVIEGPEKERARLAFAVQEGEQLVYELEEHAVPLEGKR